MQKIRETTRRKILNVTWLLASIVAIGSTLLIAGCGYPTATGIDTDAYSADGNTVSVMLEKIPELSQAGGSAAIVNDEEQIYIIIVRTGEDEYVIASNQCTHHGKALGYDDKAKQFVCASGKSRFRLDGSVVEGPAKRSLKIYDWHLEQGRLVIDLANESSAGAGE
jgi:nitrite reductase/ring-hydroxylating ferredoxin subunit